MKKKFIVLSAIICALLLILLPACDAQNAGSLKSITRPYIAQYECTEATFGGDNILDKFDYIEVNLLDKEKIQLIFKIKNSEKRVTDGKYTFDPKTHELSADIGVLSMGSITCVSGSPKRELYSTTLIPLSVLISPK